MTRGKYQFRICLMALATLPLAACGAPNLKAMTPNVRKPAAVILVIDQPPGWTVSALETDAVQRGVIADVQSISSAQLTPTLNAVTGNKSVGLVVCVQNGPIPQPELEIAKQDIAQRFELVGTSGTGDSAVNVRQVVQNTVVSGYGLGWLSGQLAMTMGIHSVGWVTDGNAELGKNTLQSALLGAYSANGLYEVTPVQLATVDPTTAGQLPRLIVTPRLLTDAEMHVLSGAGVTVISLVNQTSPVVAAMPMLPGPDAIVNDLDAFAHTNWQPGSANVNDGHTIWTNPALLPTDLVTNLDSIMTGLQNSLPDIPGAWARIPAATRQKWLVIPGIS